MRVAARYSHLNGEEYLLVHRKELWDEILERGMSSGVPYYERDLLNIMRQGRGIPAVPLVLVGVAP